MQRGSAVAIAIGLAGIFFSVPARVLAAAPCPLILEAGQSDSDGDGLPDSCDPYPSLWIGVRIATPEFALTGAGIVATFRLRQRHNNEYPLPDSVQGVRATLALDSAATFGTSAAKGKLLSGGGTNRILVEFVAYEFEIAIHDASAERVRVSVEDSERIGLEEFPVELAETFETGDGRFTHGGSDDGWELGPYDWSFGSLQRSWRTRVPSDGWLVTPPLRLSPSDEPELSLYQRPVLGLGPVEITADGGASWRSILLTTPTYNSALAVGDLAAYAGETVRIRFRAEPMGPAGLWYLDWFRLTGLANTLEFLEPEADDDGDGLSNESELALGTIPLSADSDADGVTDLADNCARVVNADQADRVHPGGPGDLCDDPDADGMPDQWDDCPDVENRYQSNRDQDARGDACDPHPDADLEVWAVTGGFGIAGEPARVTYRLEDHRSGRLLTELSGVQITLSVDGSAHFRTTALRGELLSGGGTNRALVEFVNGIAELEVSDPVLERVNLGGEDTEGLDIRFATRVFEDFERSDGGFTHAGQNDFWQLNRPWSGPRPLTGARIWSTNPFGNQPRNTRSSLLSRPYRLGPSGEISLGFWTWRGYGGGLADTSVFVTRNEGRSWKRLEIVLPTGGWEEFSSDLTPWGGSTVRLRFEFVAPPEDGSAGWSIDDLSISSVSAAIEFLTPDADGDGDGLRNAEEVTRGSDPRVADSDSDLVGDASDNCPRVANPDQSDSVHPNGIGDACDDPDGDDVVDRDDVCADVHDPVQANRDGDRRGDACDPQPDARLTIWPVTRGFALSGSSEPVVYRLEDQEGHLLSELEGIRAVLTLSGAARFGDVASPGRLIEGGGTARALVELEGGIAALEVHHDEPGVVALGAEDPDGLDLRLGGDVLEDFERADGGFRSVESTHPESFGGLWSFLDPLTGPGLAHSGLRAWGTRSAVFGGTGPQLVSPIFRVPAGALAPSLGFWTRFATRNCCDWGAVTILEPGQPYAPEIAQIYTTSGYVEKRYDLGRYAGKQIRVSFAIRSDGDLPQVDWYMVDDFALRGISAQIEYLAPELDADSDGLSNAAELELGTAPRRPDSDYDALGDAQDNCPLTANSDQVDRVHPDGSGDACDDPDADAVFDLTDNCPDAANPDQRDAVHRNGIGDACDDPDADAIPDLVDNCIDTANPSQLDRDLDRFGDACDVCPDRFNPEQQEEVACIEAGETDGECLAVSISPVGAQHEAELLVFSRQLWVPESILFEMPVNSCAESDTLEVRLNGTPLTSVVVDPARTCTYSCAPIQTFSVDDSSRISSAWKRAGENRFELIKPGSGSGLGWLRARFRSGELESTSCLRDLDGFDPCHEGCSSAYPSSVGETLSLEAPLVADQRLVRQISDPEGSPASFDISALPDGDAELCVEIERGPTLIGILDGYLVHVDPRTAGVSPIARAPRNIDEIEYDERSGRAFYANTYQIQELDIREGKALGVPFPTPLFHWALEYVGPVLYGAQTRFGENPSDLHILDPELGGSTQVGAMGANRIVGLAYDEAARVMYAAGPEGLFTIDLSTGTATKVSELGFYPWSLEFGFDGKLYSTSQINDQWLLHRIDPVIGTSEIVGSLGSHALGALTLARSVRFRDCAPFVHLGEQAIALNGGKCIAIDVEPASEENPIEPLTPGEVPVAVLGSETLDARQIDSSRLRFGPYGAPPREGAEPTLDDVDRDGFMDLVARFRTLQTGIRFDSTQACLVGELPDHGRFERCAPITPIPASTDPSDSDADGIPDASDTCPWYKSSNLSDRDGNGTGDDCECGDQDGNGSVDVGDLVAIHRAIYEPQRQTELCDANLDETCSTADLAAALARIFGRAARCSRNPWPFP